MSKKDKLQKLADLGTAFIAAAYGPAYDPHTHLVTAKVSGEQNRRMELLKIQDHFLKGVYAALQAGEAPQKDLDLVRREGMTTFIRRVDIFAAVAVENLGEEVSAKLVPNKDRTAANSKGFAKAHAPALAKLFAPRQI
jgi:hypothetical protein